jgi:hypothetical protein
VGDAVRACGINGVLLLNGSYVSAREEPGDFDLLLVGPPDIQEKKDADPVLWGLLDPEEVERQYHCTLFYIANDSAALGKILTLWDLSKEAVAKGSVEVKL